MPIAFSDSRCIAGIDSGGGMNDSIGRGDVQRPVDATEISHRIDPFQEGTSDGSSGQPGHRQRKRFRSRPEPEDHVEISDAAREALRRSEKDDDLMKY